MRPHTRLCSLVHNLFVNVIMLKATSLGRTHDFHNQYPLPVNILCKTKKRRYFGKILCHTPYGYYEYFFFFLENSLHMVSDFIPTNTFPCPSHFLQISFHKLFSTLHIHRCEQYVVFYYASFFH